jgi:hypothetical protein
MTDLSWWNPESPASTPQERKRLRRKVAAPPKGYAAVPGTGPKGETCKSCRHIERIQDVKRYRKCGLVHAYWTYEPGTNIKAGSLACSRWEAA